MTEPTDTSFQRQFRQDRRDYLAGIDFYTWTRHYHLFMDLCAQVQGDVLEVGTGDGVLRRCAEPFVRSYTVMDINPKLQPDVLGDLSQHRPELADRFDAAVVAEVLEHLPFENFSDCIGHLHSYLRPGARLFLTLPHRKSHMLVVTPRQRLKTLRFPVGLISLSEAYNRFVRRRIWIDPHHCWEIGDGHVDQRGVEAVLRARGFAIEKFMQLPYCDYWILGRAAPAIAVSAS
ncbi:methyltransferase domain-containing protein [Piscinibacter sp.]|uniref:methyltransferase domain-containing protein n=1 Tax=Piscinibacter sp. TaxID=1903157 RepID=UPI002BA4A605|nr:methyltransferase domain-containing protein [Albitalea sp.]HUG24361.1 methyltransferase domain-containing protein [Albitalea sp.]